MIRILISGAAAVVLVLAITPMVIAYFGRRGLSQPVRDDVQVDHSPKAGTPTMGGTAIVLAGVASVLLAAQMSTTLTPTGWLMLFVFVGMAAVGFIDDYIKVRMRRSLGLSMTAKIVGQAIVAVVFALLGGQFAGVPWSISVVGELHLFSDLSALPYIVWVFLLLAGFSNAVNLTDGLDGLAAGSAAMVFGAYTLIGFWMSRNADDYVFVGESAALEVAVVASAAMFASAGFLWFNGPPATIYMGDTGSLALGGLLASMALVTNTDVLLLVLGGLFVLEALSVIAQVVAFRGFGRRVLRMAPVHHHFELLGWAESSVIVRFWLLAGLGVALGLGLFYAEWVDRVGVEPHLIECLESGDGAVDTAAPYESC